MTRNVQISDAVAHAMATNRPIVALETAVVTHGLPRPMNLEVVRELVTLVRESGAEPAVVGVLDGVLHVGLGAAQLDRLANDDDAAKLSARDLAWAAVTGANGGTTVAGTLAACRIVGLRVFATGGIGGVHPDFARRHDVSADLHALAATPCCVVSAGAKALLDLPATVEHLDRLGVPVVGYRTDLFPRFYSVGSPSLRVPRRLNDPKQVTRFLDIHWGDLKQTTGVLLCNPIPEEASLDADEIKQALQQAEAAAQQAGITGPQLTPYVLDQVAKLTDGRALDANLALLYHNVKLAVDIALARVEPRS
ncbi:MAG: pseudouridine-5'-phosphate glycosidase [Phycisphaerales bacterium]|nr:pseudouridine-5'-phosphate glycosidase [Phycisphaerales bacterium]